MVKGILGRKIGMTQVFTKSGKLIPVTVIEVGTNVVTQIKTTENDGYDAIQLGFSDKKEKSVTKASLGHTNKAGVTPKRFFKEIRGVDVSQYSLGQEIKGDVFVQGEIIDVSGISKGKGFQGAIKRHNYSRGPMSHGSHHHRSPGSLGNMLQKRVLKGKKLPGHMGVDAITIQNLEIVDIDLENGVILVKGNVPGPKKSLVFVKSSVKKTGEVNKFEELMIYSDAEMAEEVQEEIASDTPVEEEVVEEIAEEATEEVVEEEQVSEEVTEEVAEETTETEEEVI